MPNDTPRRNIPVPDELHEVRAEMKRLEDREAVLRQILLSDPTARTGASYLAEIKDRTTRQLDRKELSAAYPDIVEQHTHPVTRTYVELKGITADGEIVSVRQLAKLEAEQ